MWWTYVDVVGLVTEGRLTRAAAGRERNAHSLNRQRTGLAVALVLAVPVATRFPSLAVLAVVTAALWAMIAYETHLYGETRGQLRRDGPAFPDPAVR